MAGTPNGPGSVLAGRFALEDLLDENDGARFWRATDRTLARSVAVHVLPDTDPRAGSLLVAARRSALVSDPRLLRVLDAASTDGFAYVVNEWGSGVSLDRMLVEGPLSPRRAAWVVREVAGAIATAHRNGVAHGRLLPENVMVSESGSVKVIGFVIDAVLRHPDAATGPAPRLVTSGEAVGVHRSDVLNLGGLLYAALVGRWPGTEGSTIPPAPTEHGRPLRPRQVRAGVPRPLDAICERVLNADCHHGPPIETAHDVYAALSDYIGDPTGSTAVGDPVRAQAGAPPGWPVGHGATSVTADRPVTGDAADPAPDPATVAARDPGTDPEATQAAPFVALDAAAGRRPHADRGPRAAGPDLGEPTQAARTDAGVASGTTRAAAPPSVPTERPLFADGPARRAAVANGSRPAGDTGSFTGGQRSTGAGNGRLPAAWGPDSDQPPAGRDPGWDARDRGRGVPGRTWLRLAVVLGVVLLLLVAVLAAFNLGRGGSSQAPTPAQQSRAKARSSAARSGAVVAITGVRDFDPQGDPAEENPDLAGLATDGNPGTAWRTNTYYDPLDKLKSGVGLLVDLGRPRPVRDVRLTLIGSPTSVQVLAGPDDAAAPTSTDGLTKVATATRAGTSVDLPLRKAVTTRWMVVWLTSLPAVPGGFQGRVAEISVRS